jgi:hypothetical protein
MSVYKMRDLQVVVHTYAGYYGLTQCELILVEQGHSELDVQSNTGKGLFKDAPFQHHTLCMRPTIELLKDWAKKHGDIPFPSGKDIILCQHSETMGGFVRRIHPIFNP